MGMVPKTEKIKVLSKDGKYIESIDRKLRLSPGARLFVRYKGRSYFVKKKNNIFTIILDKASHIDNPPKLIY